MQFNSEIQQQAVDSVFIWAQRDTRARLVVDDDLEVHWSNSAAVQIAREADLFDCTGQKFGLRKSRWAGAFQAFVRASNAEVSTLCIPRSSDDHVLCTAVNLSSNGRGHLTGLTLRCATEAVRLSGAALEAAFRLTMAERRIVETLFAGQTADEVGADLRVSVGTVRAHIRHIYEKVNVGSREAMFHKLLPYLSTH